MSGAGSTTTGDAPWLLVDAARRVAGCTDLQQLLDTLCSQAVRVAGSRSAIVSHVPRDEPASQTSLGASFAWTGDSGPSEPVRSALFALLRRVSVERTPVGFGARERRFERMLDGFSEDRELADGAIVAVPVIADAGRVEAVLVVVGSDDSTFSPDQVRGLDELARCAALALRNVTSLARARADQERLRLFGTVDRDVMWSWDIRTDRIWWGNETLGCPVGASGQTIAWKLEGIHPDDASRVHQSLRRAIDTDAVTWTEHFRIRRKDLSWVLVEDHCNVIRDQDGRATGLVGVMRDISDREHNKQLSDLNDELAHRAVHDSLTGLPNRVLLLDRLGRALKQTVRRPGAVAVCFLDVDRFKHINDEFGHAAGDQVLVTIARRLSAVLRGADTIARLGGDEFVILLEGAVSAERASATAARLLRALAAPLSVGDRDVELSVSIGIALSHDDQEDGERLLDDADAAMYQAKQRGGARYEFFDAAMRARVRNRHETEAALRRAVVDGELRLVYQPEVDLADGRVVGLEALLRWEHPRRGLLVPGEFLSLAEDTGLIVPMGRWVLSQACRQISALRAAHTTLAEVVVWVNLSSQELVHEGLVDCVAGALAESETDPSQLGIEITESALLTTAAGQSILTALQRLGVRLAIDDFGTGFSSLSYLRLYPVSALKIDRSFVRGLGRVPEDSLIVNAIVVLAHALGLRVIGEGIETPEQAEILRSLECDIAQGYHFGGPVGIEDLHRGIGATTRVGTPAATAGWAMR